MKGFTLIELLIVVAIIGILAAIAAPNFLNAQMKAKIARTEADQQAISTAMEMYILDWNTYPEDHDWPSTSSQRGLFRLTTPMAYIASLPRDVFPSQLAKNFSEGNPFYEVGTGMKGNGGKPFPAKAFILASPGPDLLEEMDGNDSFPNGTFFNPFDVSNGLHSRGDIYRLGGDYYTPRWRNGFLYVGPQ